MAHAGSGPSREDAMGTAAIFALPDHVSLLTRALPGHPELVAGRSTVARFSNGELYLHVDTPVAGRLCAVLGSLAPPDERLLSVLLLAHTLRRERSPRIVALLPYLGYARQDLAEPSQSLGAAWAGALLAAAGVARVLTVDVHSARAAACFPIPVESLSPAALFARVLVRQGLRDLSVVAPDEGALDRCWAVAHAAGISMPLVCLRKRRDAHGVTHSAITGSVTPRVAVVDDILDTGRTLVSACAELQRAGAREITVFATHGLFTGDRWRDLQGLGVPRIYTTDSVPGAQDRGGPMVEVLSVGELIVGAFAKLASGPPLRGELLETGGSLESSVERIVGPAPADDSSVP